MRKKTVVLVGGCFDVLHPGHVLFLEKAKEMGDKLVVLLESDQTVRQLKGAGRPIHSQRERAKILLALRFVDQVVQIPFMRDDTQYDRLIKKLKPDIIAVTKGYGNIDHHQRVARLVGAKLKYVTSVYGKYSTSRLVKFFK